MFGETDPVQKAALEIFENLMNGAINQGKIDINGAQIIRNNFNEHLPSISQFVSKNYPQGVSVDDLTQIIRKIINDIHSSMSRTQPSYITPVQSSFQSSSQPITPAFGGTNLPSYAIGSPTQPQVIQQNQPIRVQPQQQQKVELPSVNKRPKLSVIMRKNDVSDDNTDSSLVPVETIKGISAFNTTNESHISSQHKISLKESFEKFYKSPIAFKTTSLVPLVVDVIDSNKQFNKFSLFDITLDDDSFYFLNIDSIVEYLYHIFTEVIDIEKIIGNHITKSNLIKLQNKNKVFRINFHTKFVVRKYIKEIFETVDNIEDIIDKQFVGSNKDKGFINFINYLLKYSVRLLDEKNIDYTVQIESIEDLSDLIKLYYNKTSYSQAIISNMMSFVIERIRSSNEMIVNVPMKVQIFNADFPYPINKEIIVVNNPTVFDVFTGDLSISIFNKSLIYTNNIISKDRNTIFDRKTKLYSII